MLPNGWNIELKTERKIVKKISDWKKEKEWCANVYGEDGKKIFRVAPNKEKRDFVGSKFITIKIETFWLKIKILFVTVEQINSALYRNNADRTN